TMPEHELASALQLVSAHRDQLLNEWLKGAGPLLQPVQGPLAMAVSYDPARKLVQLRLKSGAMFVYPAQCDEGLNGASDAQIAAVEVLGDGDVLYWKEIKLLRRVTDILLAYAASEPWRQRLLAQPFPPVPPKMPAGSPPHAGGTVKTLLGLILQREQYVTPAQLQAIASEQAKQKAQGREVTFGQAAIRLGYLSPEQLKFAVHLQGRLAHAAGGGKPLGVYLLESAALLPSQLLEALEEQERTGQKLGEILVARELITASTLELFLSRQQSAQAPLPAAPRPQPTAEPAAPAPRPQAPAQPAQAPPRKIKSLLGIILEREHYMNQGQVQAVSKEQDRLKAEGKVKTFGELALNMGYVTPEQLKFAVQLQTKLAYTPGSKKPLGAILLENDVCMPSQIHHALESQARTGRQLGEVLLEQGVLSETMLELFLKMQEQG
ncbi:MAG: hypothetical protein ACLGIN_17315, partial [Candidatus Sericytochromatia bacterium]